MASQRVERLNAKQRMDKPAIAHIDFGRLDEPFADVRMIGLLRDNQDEDAATIRMRELCRA